MTLTRLSNYLAVTALLILLGPAARATTLFVHCESRFGLNTITAAIKALRSQKESNGPDTINVSGPCRENVVIQSMDRLTLNAAAGASITDASNGSSDVIQIGDSHAISVNNFTISGGNNGVTCSDGSLCRLNGNTIQNVGNDGVAVLTMSQAVVAGGAVQGNASLGGQHP